MGGHKTISSTSNKLPPEPPVIPPEADYHVTDDGFVIPDCMGNYFEGAIYNGQPWYGRFDSQYYIWWNGADSWYISLTVGIIAPGAWIRTDAVITGLYDHLGAVQGHPTVVAGPE